MRVYLFEHVVAIKAPGDYSPPYFWERDFAYQIRWGGDLLAEVPGALDLARETAANVLTRSPSAPLSDGAIFRAQMLASFSLAAHNDSDFFCAHLPGVLQQLNLTYGNPAIFKNGLVVAPPTGTHCYGFTDSINKSGALLFCSVLHYETLLQLSLLASDWNCSPQLLPFMVNNVLVMRQALQSPTGPLWMPEIGMFRVDSGLNAGLVDVWGSAYAVYTGATSTSQSEKIMQWLVNNEKSIFQAGQVRHLPSPSHWPSGVAAFQGNGEWEQYQNGGYWATPGPFLLALSYLWHNIFLFCLSSGLGGSCSLQGQ
eukprot:m.210405 g.210405  ORF g.210405 m.210405 type:complete len:312 (-) comp15823_c0_seq15:318-1253(-)